MVNIYTEKILFTLEAGTPDRGSRFYKKTSAPRAERKDYFLEELMSLFALV
jgi:hypothetical protein